MLAIFDMSTINVERYNSELLKRCIGKYIAYVDDPDCCDDLSCPDATLICTTGWSIKRIMISFEEQSVSVVMISGQRPADFRLVIAANMLSIPIVYKMHGLYVAKVKRNVAFYFLSAKKVIRTLGYLINIGCFTKKVRIPIGILLSFVFGASRKPWMIAEILQVDHCLIWSEYWRPWHERYWCMKPRKGWAIIGNPDTAKSTKAELNADGVCYVYQTLVEDGRVSKQVMESFYDGLAIIACNKKLLVHVKWHVRGDVMARKDLESRGFIIHDERPFLAKVYIGHFSSLLGLVPIVGGSLVIFELEGHVTPKPIRQCATIIVNDMADLEKALSFPCVFDENKREQAEYYFGSYYSAIIEDSIVSQYLYS
ncbi:MAG: hypothetical protein A6F70_03170 [Cycloclasticus sp. symbiont of Bathymodiolus heckerae]|nr:MAG: hypothetical protein A6F70_03170 [Cycloclasticus sp. symbiont of Bathymodiolus heckerae]